MGQVSMIHLIMSSTLSVTRFRAFRFTLLDLSLISYEVSRLDYSYLWVVTMVWGGIFLEATEASYI